MSEKYKRINILIREEQYQNVRDAKLSLSGLVRDLLDDRFSNTIIRLSVSERIKKLYDLVISNFGASDKDLEPYLVESLDKFLDDKTEHIKELKKKLKNR